MRADGLGVVASREYHHGMFESAMQVGPGVVERGLLDISERDLARPKYFRTFVGTCGYILPVIFGHQKCMPAKYAITIPPTMMKWKWATTK